MVVIAIPTLCKCMKARSIQTLPPYQAPKKSAKKPITLAKFLDVPAKLSYSGKLSWEKTFVNWWKNSKDSCGKTFTDCLLVLPKDATL